MEQGSSATCAHEAAPAAQCDHHDRLGLGQGNCRCWWGTKQNQFGKRSRRQAGGEAAGAKGSRASRKRKITWPITRALDSRTAAQQAVTAAYQAVRESMEMINHRGRYPVHTHTHTQGRRLMPRTRPANCKLNFDFDNKHTSMSTSRAEGSSFFSCCCWSSCYPDLMAPKVAERSILR